MSDFGALHVHIALRRHSIGRSMSALPTNEVVIATSPGPADDADWVPDARPVHSSLPHEGFSARNDNWTRVQTAVLGLFKKRPRSAADMTDLLSRIRELTATAIGPLIYDYYKNQLLKKGLWSMRDAIYKEVAQGGDLLSELGDTWDYFYMEIMPAVQLVFFPLTAKDLSIREVNIVSFRDNIVLRTEIEDCIENVDSEIPASIQQMLLVLQSVCDSTPPNENYMRLERIVACVVKPFLGFGGLYMGTKVPLVKAKRVSSVRRPSKLGNRPEAARHGRTVSGDFPKSLKDDSEEVERMRQRMKHGRHGSLAIAVETLSPVSELDLDARRHSSFDVFA